MVREVTVVELAFGLKGEEKVAALVRDPEPKPMRLLLREMDTAASC